MDYVLCALSLAVNRPPVTRDRSQRKRGSPSPAGLPVSHTKLLRHGLADGHRGAFPALSDKLTGVGYFFIEVELLGIPPEKLPQELVAILAEGPESVCADREEGDARCRTKGVRVFVL